MIILTTPGQPVNKMSFADNPTKCHRRDSLGYLG